MNIGVAINGLSDSLSWNSIISSVIGAILGGVLALLGVWISQRLTKKEKEMDIKRKISTLYFLLIAKIELIENAQKICDKEKNIYSPVIVIFSAEERLKIYEYFSYAQKILNLKELSEVHSFCTRLQNLEVVRTANKEANKEAYKQVYKQVYKGLLDAAVQTISGSEDTVGIRNIASKLKQYIDA